jgi:excisionase family DNA binding protein
MTSKRNNDPARVPRFFTIGDIAEFFDVSIRTGRRWIKSGDLPVHRFGSSAVRVSESI